MKNADKPISPIVGAAVFDIQNHPDLILEGLTKREYFAAMAMQGILASPIISVQTMTDKDKALYGVNMADHLLEILEKS